ncbi:MAG: biotin/lipoyl-containing protein [Spirosomataceae bacterium]
MYQAIINDQPPVSVALTETGYTLDGKPFTWDIVQTVGQTFHVLHQHRSYRIEVVEADTHQKKYGIRVNGEFFEIVLKDSTDLFLDQLGVNSGKATGMSMIKAPMPGLIYQLPVQVGDQVKKGDVLLILVAMKMENAIKATGDGVVKSISVKLGDTVEKNQVLISFA